MTEDQARLRQQLLELTQQLLTDAQAVLEDPIASESEKRRAARDITGFLRVLEDVQVPPGQTDSSS